ncbi:CPBP family intramembrane glutamic endopeptidase [Pedobacter sp. N23S346]
MLTILGSITVQFLIGHLNLILFNKDYSFYEPFRSHPYGKILMIISIAVFPAIFEEMAFRGFVMEKLTKVVDNQQAIYISSFMFFIIHFSLVSVFWLLPFAILLGYLRIKEKTIWYGIAIHFLFNLTACLGEIFNLS